MALRAAARSPRAKAADSRFRRRKFKLRKPFCRSGILSHLEEEVRAPLPRARFFLPSRLKFLTPWPRSLRFFGLLSSLAPGGFPGRPVWARGARLN